MSAFVLLRVITDPDLARGLAGSSLRLDDASGDAIALALSYRRACGASLHALASGPPEWDAALREAVALGLDDVRRTWGPALAEGDIVAHAHALAALVPDDAMLVVAGATATDHGSGLLPFALAELLGWPAIEDVMEVLTERGRPAVRVRAVGGRRLTCALPSRAVLVAAKGSLLPYPTVARKLAARKASIAVSVPGAHPALEQRFRIEGFGPARPVTRHLLQPSASASAAGRLRQLMAGGVASSTAGQTLRAGDGLAAQVADLLAREGLL